MRRGSLRSDQAAYRSRDPFSRGETMVFSHSNDAGLAASALTAHPPSRHQAAKRVSQRRSVWRNRDQNRRPRTRENHDCLRSLCRLSGVCPNAPRMAGRVSDIGGASRTPALTGVRLAFWQVGTPLYFSPEICQGRPYDQKSDVWGMGCLMHELAALRPPFHAQNQLLLAQKIIRDPPDSKVNWPKPRSPTLRRTLPSLKLKYRKVTLAYRHSDAFSE